MAGDKKLILRLRKHNSGIMVSAQERDVRKSDADRVNSRSVHSISTYT